MNRDGQGAAEYIIIVVLIAAGIILALRYFGSDISVVFNNMSISVAALSTPGKNGDAHEVEGGGSVTQKWFASNGEQPTDTTESELTRPQKHTGETIQEKVDRLRAPRPGTTAKDDYRGFSFDWQTLTLIAGVIIFIGLGIVFFGGRRRKRGENSARLNFRDGQQGGQALVEFIFIAITFLFVLLGVIQLAMCLNAYTMVRYAAYNAARAAIVHANDPSSMRYYALDAARQSLLPIFPRHGVASNQVGMVWNYEEAREIDQIPNIRFSGAPLTQVTILPNAGQIAGNQRFDDPNFAEYAYITVKVKHYYRLMMPLVNRLLFYVYLKYHDAGGFDRDNQESLMRMARVTDFERRYGEFHGVEYRIPIIAHYTMPLQTDYIQ